MTIPQTVPERLFRKVITHKNAKEQNSDNNTTEYAVVATDCNFRKPNTSFENACRILPMRQLSKAGSATWNMWVYEYGRLVLKSYGVTVETRRYHPVRGCFDR